MSCNRSLICTWFYSDQCRQFTVDWNSQYWPDSLPKSDYARLGFLTDGDINYTEIRCSDRHVYQGPHISNWPDAVIVKVAACEKDRYLSKLFRKNMANPNRIKYELVPKPRH